MKILDVLTSPWAIVPEKLIEIQNIYYTHLRGEKIRTEDILALTKKQAGAEREEKGYTVDGSVAVLPIEGVIAKKMNLFSKISGGMSTQLAERDFKAATADPLVKSVLLYVDSPGGTVDGTQELAEVIEAARGQKPIVAFTDGVMASGAYWIGAAADLVYISGGNVQVGSIGVVTAHRDTSKAEESMGVKVTEVVAGKYKRIVSEHQPLSEEGRAVMQEAVDHVYAEFVNDVARMRGLEVPEDGAIPWADGRVFMGRKGIEAGLADGVSSMAALVDRLNNEPGFVAREKIRIGIDRRLNK